MLLVFCGVGSFFFSGVYLSPVLKREVGEISVAEVVGIADTGKLGGLNVAVGVLEECGCGALVGEDRFCFVVLF